MATFYCIQLITWFSPSARSYYKRVPRAYDFAHDQRKEISLRHEQTAASSVYLQTMENSNQEKTKIASVPMSHYKPEEISLEVDNEKISLHGLHRFERENGFISSEFQRYFKLPQGVDPRTVTSRISQNGDLIIEGMKFSKRGVRDRRFKPKLDFRGLKPEEVLKLRENELTVTGKCISEDPLSRNYNRRILLPFDVGLGSVTSHLSKEGLLSIEATSIQQKFFKATKETRRPFEEPSIAELFALV